MENIKTQLLDKIEDINTVADPMQDEDEALTLTSYYFDQKTQTPYELCVELIAHKDERQEPGNFHADRGDWEGRGSYFVICGISIQNIYIFKNGDEEVDFTITNQEAEEAIKF